MRVTVIGYQILEKMTKLQAHSIVHEPRYHSIGKLECNIWRFVANYRSGFYAYLKLQFRQAFVCVLLMVTIYIYMWVSVSQMRQVCNQQIMHMIIGV